MRSKQMSVFGLIVLALTLSSQAWAQSIINSNFEIGAKRVPEGWYPTYTNWLRDTMEYVVLDWDDKVKHSGERSVSIEVLKGFPVMKHTVFYNWTATVDGWEVGKTYEISGWVKTEKIKDAAAIFVQCWKTELSGRPGDMTAMESKGIGGTKDWTLVKTRVKIPSQTQIVRVRLGFSTEWNVGGKAWFDDIDVKEVMK